MCQGNNVNRFEELVQDACALQNGGAFAILLEAIPNYPAGLIAQKMQIPIYGIGAGKDVDGVLAIVNDVIGLGDFNSRFVKHFCESGNIIHKGIEDYVRAVRERAFPAEEQFYPLNKIEKDGIQKYAEEYFK